MYQVFTDGSSSRKNGTIGTSYIVFQDRDNKPIKTFCKGFIDKQARNGIAELLGVYYCLRDICEDILLIPLKSEIIIYSDSQYVVKEFTEWFRNQMIKNFFDIKNKEVIIYVLWMLDILRKEGYIIKFEWIRGHQKEETFEVYGNNYADNLAVHCHNNEVFQDTDMIDIEELVKDLKVEIKEEEILKNIKKTYLDI